MDARNAQGASTQATGSLDSQETCWTLIRGAADGGGRERSEFGRRYLPVVRRYLESRWRGRLSPDEIDDATQEVFVECLKDGGLLERARADRVASFQAYLYGAIRNVARRVEERRANRVDAPASSSFHLDERMGGEDRLSRVFDRAWARNIMREAARRHRELAREAGPDAEKRVKLMELRFHDGLPIREIADLWEEDAAALHHAYARARKEFLVALRGVVAFHHPGSPESVDQECRKLLTLLD